MSDRKAYQDKIEAQLKEWNAELEKLQARALKADADARIELGKKVDTLREHFRDAQNAFVGLVAAGEGAWNDAKKKAEDARTAFADAIERTRKEFSAEPAKAGR